MGINIDMLPESAKRQILLKLARSHAAAQKDAARAQNRDAVPSEGKRKYKNTPTFRIGETGLKIKFDSKREAERFDELRKQQELCAIRNLKLQPEYTLQEAYTTPDGEKVAAIKYRADFSYERNLGRDAYGTERWVNVTEDAKGMRTDLYKLKSKMFLDKYGYPITEV